MHSYPVACNSSNGNLSSAHLVSCMQSTSGCAASSQRVTCGKRAMIELTFQVAIFMLRQNSHRDAETRRNSTQVMNHGMRDGPCESSLRLSMLNLLSAFFLCVSVPLW